MRPTIAVLYHDAGSAALIDALRRWRAAYASQTPYDELLAGKILTITSTMTIHPRGYATVYVEIEARDRMRSDNFWYEAHLVAGEIKLDAIGQATPQPPAPKPPL